jgi:predicted DNA-binding transcriptional regulator AlpA
MDGEGVSYMHSRAPLATPEEVATYYGVPVATLYQWRHRGIGPKASRIGRHLRYLWEDVEAYRDQRATVGGEAA